jgi:hypothetical protein
MGLPPCLRRRRLPPRFHPHPARRAQSQRRPFPRRGHRLVQELRHRRRERDERQWRGLPQWQVRRGIADAGLKHKRIRPYTPRTNGKAERFIQSCLREWAYAHPFHSSAERTAAMLAWICHYNTTRPHAAHQGQPPSSKLTRDNLLGNDN